MMKQLSDTHRARINIRDQFVADIIVTPIKNESGKIDGYVVKLMDVTTKAEEEIRKDKLIEELSTLIIKIWDKTIAIPLIGAFDQERSEHLTSFVLNECAEEGVQYALIDLSGLNSFDESVSIKSKNECLWLIGTECIIVGITSKLAMSFGLIKNDIATFRNAHDGLEYMIKSGQK
ncbi:STAS domain-containing protein [Pseudalkalibacillus sp. A8]|uniref:STAS domain-containing protein n=1 Tax=Pseudalkalibacillus sp. A8 TaxID=3382641 RepID=UPI0038B4ADE6